jgi:hypothetical protein
VFVTTHTCPTGQVALLPNPVEQVVGPQAAVWIAHLPTVQEANVRPALAQSS